MNLAGEAPEARETSLACVAEELAHCSSPTPVRTQARRGWRWPTALGCRVDRHEEPGKGAIGLTAFRCLMKDARFVDTIGVLETPFPERYGENIRLLESLCRRK
ncbi:hypothetical protein ASNO1_40500 [Corallococcus caeni]|uniref:Uncharacterized protein n=1 Tax=Corallococcus caeni TaxID=3082388 RepID=A0ABQ6QUU5_9BACT|nr:hypothetical protein ASNO1_40500 [Corallococcus sp. NO1]